MMPSSFPTLSKALVVAMLSQCAPTADGFALQRQRASPASFTSTAASTWHLFAISNGNNNDSNDSTDSNGNSQCPDLFRLNNGNDVIQLDSDFDDIPEHRALNNGVVDRSKFYRERPVRADGTYPCKPLEKDTVNIAVLQTDCEDLRHFYDPDDARCIEEVQQRNLETMLEHATKACNGAASNDGNDDGNSKKPDILLFHEFPLTGALMGPQWNRQHQLDWAIEIDQDTELLQPLMDFAKANDVYIIFGSYAKDTVDWPDHILSLQTVINRQGKIVNKIWKPKNIKRHYGSIEITTTTVESVRSKFQSLYGMDAEFPVIQTEFGNIAVSTVQLDPFVYSAFAMKGAEIMLRTSTLFYREDMITTALTHQMYSAMANIPFAAFPDYGGHSMIVDPQGKVMAEVDSAADQGIVMAEIPIAEFRKQRTVPKYSLDLTKELFAHYQDEIPSDHMDLPPEDLPQNGREMKVHLDSQSRWMTSSDKKTVSKKN
mmetsp:Transcript_28490/g.80236  ORF Transcript_28490/g.80236 Transcript_28490/m.80236 type:complete len:487 (-) Transcript_28490:1885-3345(-)